MKVESNFMFSRLKKSWNSPLLHPKVLSNPDLGRLSMKIYTEGKVDTREAQLALQRHCNYLMLIPFITWRLTHLVNCY